MDVSSGESGESESEASSDEYEPENGDVESDTDEDEPQPNFTSGSESDNVPLSVLAGRVPPSTSTMVWTQEDNIPRRYAFSGRPGVKLNNLTAQSTPLEVFHAFFPQDLLDSICIETNRYHQQNERRVTGTSHARPWNDVTVDELQAVFAILVTMGINKKPEMQHYWSTDPVFHCKFIANTMPRDRFMDILKNLHFRNNNEAEDDRLYKLRPVIETFDHTFKSVYTPDREIATDESLVKFKGRLKFRQYNPAKRARFGIKIYKVSQSSLVGMGYTHAFRIYTGEDKSDIPASSKIVLDLNAALLGKGYTIALDNWYSSPNLFRALHKQRCNVVGTVRKHRKNMPADLKTVKLRTGEVVSRSTESGLMALVWKDKKEVRMLSTMHNSDMAPTGKRDREGNERLKPRCVIEYNRCKVGVDYADQRLSTYDFVRKSVKWYKKLFFYLFDMCLLNSFIVYKVLGCAHLGGRNQFLDYRLKLVKEIIENSALPDYTRGRPPMQPCPARLSGRHFPTEQPLSVNGNKPRKRCVVCKRRSTVMCDVCEVAICPVPCFRQYHTRTTY